MKLFDRLRGIQKDTQEKPVRKEPVVSVVTRDEKVQLISGVLLHPLITEKGTRLEAGGTYQFAVEKNAEKVHIARAFEARYGVRPIAVRVMNRRGKWVRFGKTSGARAAWKRALITLPKGKTINVHEGV